MSKAAFGFSGERKHALICCIPAEAALQQQVSEAAVGFVDERKPAALQQPAH